MRPDEEALASINKATYGAIHFPPFVAATVEIEMRKKWMLVINVKSLHFKACGKTC